jgi:cytoskeletal protein RodZ
VFELGISLREARTRQGLDIPQAELATKIRAKYLRALEEEHFDVLPAETYVKGFLRTYADFLGLDGQLYVDEYESRFAVEQFVDAPVSRRSRQHELSFERRAVVLALVGVTALAALVIAAWKFGGASPSTPNVIPPQSAPSGLVFSGAGTYVEVRHASASGKVLYEGTLQAGDLNAIAGQRFWIRILHPKHLRLTLNGKIVSLPARASLKVIVTPTSTSVAR